VFDLVTYHKEGGVMSNQIKNKHLSATVLMMLAILDRFPEGAYLTDVIGEYEESGIDVSEPSVRTYINRVIGAGLVDRKKETDGSRRTIYSINQVGSAELDWWREVVG